MSRIDIGKNIRKPTTVRATAEAFLKATSQQQTGRICAELKDALESYRRGELSKADYKTMKADLKLGLPFYTPHAHFAKGYKSNEGEPVDSGKALLDVDDFSEGQQLYEQRLKGHEQALGVNAAYETASGNGFALLFDIPEGLTRQQAQAWMADKLGNVAYDKAVHEMERAAYIPARDHFFYIDEQLMFGDELKPAVLSPEELERWQAWDPNPQKQQKTEAAAESVASQEPSARAMTVFDDTLEMTGLTLELLNTDGVRHNTLRLLLPTLCQMMPQAELLGVLERKMPEYSKEDDCRLLVNSFYGKYVDPNRPMNQQQKEVFLRSLKVADGRQSDEEAKEPKRQWTVNAKQLPIGIKESMRGNPPALHLPLIVGMMPALMALASDVSFRYCDGRIHYLGGMAIIKAPQANNKSAVKEVVDLWLRMIRKEDAAAREREEETSAQNRGRKNSERAKPDPKELVREVPITISCSRLLKRLKCAKGKTLYSFCNEMDTLLKTNGAGSWSAKYDIYREAFDRGNWGQDFNSDQAESGLTPVAYNWTILSTPGALRRCFKGDNVENGLSSRMMLAELPDGTFAKITKFEQITERDQSRIDEAVALLRAANGFYDTPRLRSAIGKWVEQKRQEAVLAMDLVKDTYRRRAAVIGFRCGVVFMLLAGKETNACVDFALLMADYTLEMQLANFGPTLRKQYARDSEEPVRYAPNRVAFNELPQSFVLSDLRALKGPELSDAGLYSIIRRWTVEGWIERKGKCWTKVTKE